MAIKITKENASDLSVVYDMTKGLYGKLFGDKIMYPKIYLISFTLRIYDYLLVFVKI